MAVGFTTTYAISAYHHVSSNPAHDEVYSIQHNVIKIVSNLQQDGGIWGYSGFSSTNKTDHYAITEISLKVALNTITSPLPLCSPYRSVQHALFWHSSSVLLLPWFCQLHVGNCKPENKTTCTCMIIWQCHDNISISSFDNVMIIFHFHNSLCSLDNVMIIFQFHNSFSCLILYSFCFFVFFSFY